MYKLRKSRTPPKCGRCRHHKVICPVRGHKRYCPYHNCTCEGCMLIVQRQKICKEQLALRRLEKLEAERRMELTQHKKSTRAVNQDSMQHQIEDENRSVTDKAWGCELEDKIKLREKTLQGFDHVEVNDLERDITHQSMNPWSSFPTNGIANSHWTPQDTCTSDSSIQPYSTVTSQGASTSLSDEKPIYTKLLPYTAHYCQPRVQELYGNSHSGCGSAYGYCREDYTVSEGMPYPDQSITPALPHHTRSWSYPCHSHTSPPYYCANNQTEYTPHGGVLEHEGAASQPAGLYSHMWKQILAQDYKNSLKGCGPSRSWTEGMESVQHCEESPPPTPDSTNHAELSPLRSAISSAATFCALQDAISSTAKNSSVSSVPSDWSQFLGAIESLKQCSSPRIADLAPETKDDSFLYGKQKFIETNLPIRHSKQYPVSCTFMTGSDVISGKQAGNDELLGKNEIDTPNNEPRSNKTVSNTKFGMNIIHTADENTSSLLSFNSSDEKKRINDEMPLAKLGSYVLCDKTSIMSYSTKPETSNIQAVTKGAGIHLDSSSIGEPLTGNDIASSCDTTSDMEAVDQSPVSLVIDISDTEEK